MPNRWTDVVTPWAPDGARNVTSINVRLALTFGQDLKGGTDSLTLGNHRKIGNMLTFLPGLPWLGYFMVPNWVYVNAPPVKRVFNRADRAVAVIQYLDKFNDCGIMQNTLEPETNLFWSAWPLENVLEIINGLWRTGNFIARYFGHILTHCVMSPTLSQHRSGCTL